MTKRTSDFNEAGEAATETVYGLQNKIATQLAAGYEGLLGGPVSDDVLISIVEAAHAYAEQIMDQNFGNVYSREFDAPLTPKEVADVTKQVEHFVGSEHFSSLFGVYVKAEQRLAEETSQDNTDIGADAWAAAPKAF